MVLSFRHRVCGMDNNRAIVVSHTEDVLPRIHSDAGNHQVGDPMNCEPNTIYWNVGDLVIHDADEKSERMLMRVVETGAPAQP